MNKQQSNLSKPILALSIVNLLLCIVFAVVIFLFSVAVAGVSATITDSGDGTYEKDYSDVAAFMVLYFIVFGILGFISFATGLTGFILVIIGAIRVSSQNTAVMVLYIISIFLGPLFSMIGAIIALKNKIV
ncbi:hypothetical protein NPA13_02860 [Mycoplasma sp. 2045]|uniref:hypothetical protein n=1 Tax=unclassified Mycoplasma TaxID=2683645 RepID=UPI00211BE8AC|nr:MULTISPECIES: hypothetical protein [unclassified Mycoplasma]MEA4162875.1 hypothetical protein [Mycoplasma sp. 4404]MEA4191350.1 hypothetical protein [Mycoplasma sp. 2248]MEA4333892.1 hypothetical protein [Mycoplasma sp. 1232]UUM20369.1 hypothetical protein NPA13_02860 [Mycoplasma sp. 2045]